MPPDLYFLFTLALKMAVTAGFVVVATTVAERAGPLVGGLVTTLPLGTGPVYVFLALDHGPDFIAASAVSSLAINAITTVFVVVYAILAQKRSLLVSQSAAMLVWAALAWMVHEVNGTLVFGLVLNAVALTACIVLSWPMRHAPMPRVPAHWTDYALRAALAAVLVGVTVTLSFRIGPSGSGILAVFPIIMISVQIILHRRVGGKACAAVMANAVVGLIGFAAACVVLHFTAVPFGAAIGLALALFTSIAWSLLVYAARRRGTDSPRHCRA
jgi:hypothetical protein